MIVPQTEIVVTHGGVEIVRQTVAPGEYVIGSAPDCDVPVGVEAVSRQHARLTVNYDHALIEDLGSSNGTLVGGKSVTGITRLWPNQKIEIGLATIELRRLRDNSDSLPPQSAFVREVLPEHFLRDKKYDIGDVVAQGGMGAILEAREEATGRTVAMKVMLESGSPGDVMRFVAEAKVTAQLEHPNIVPVHELSVDENDQVFYTMKFVRGVTLRDVLEKLAESDKAALAKYPLATLLTVFQKVCDALAFAHSKGVIHRDLKPANLMLGDYGEVLVMDWGLAKTGGEDLLAEKIATSPLSPLVTMDGKVMGTPQYMSPEQARGESAGIDSRTDIYALGAILYQILALRPPIQGEDPMDVVEKVGRGETIPLLKTVAGLARRPPHLPGGHVPESLDAVVRKAMAFDPAARYRKVEALQADLTAYQNGFATKAEKAGLAKHLLLFVKRHKAVSVAVCASLILLVGLSTAFTLRVFHERNLAVAERNRAQGAQAAAEKAQAEAETERNRAQTALADAESQRNRAEKALADVKTERSRADQEHSTAETQRNLANQAHSTAETERTRAEGESGRAEKAMADLKKTAPAFYSLAKLRLEEGEFSDAIEQIGFALDLDVANPDYHLLCAEALQSTRKYSEAIAEYRRVLALRPDDKSAKSNMLVCKRLSGDSSPADAATTLGLSAWWRAEGDARDSVGLSDGILVDGAAMGPGLSGKAFLLNGSTSYVSVKNSSAWAPGNGDFTIALWAKFTAVSNKQAFLAGDGVLGSNSQWIFQLADSKLQLQVNGEKPATLSSAYVAMRPFQWYQIAVSRRSDRVAFHVNGAEISAVNWADEIPPTTGPHAIGCASGAMFVRGFLDDIRIYNRALSANEIQTLFQSQSAVPTPKPTAPETAGKPGMAERINQVKQLLDQGLINKDDYDRKVKEITE
ncbi:MAG: protein kinase [Verrucomicrobiae bacterium]